MKVYVITQGSYSDYHIVGVKLTREEAEKVVTAGKNKREEIFDYDMHIEEFDTDNITVESANEVKDMYECIFDYKTLENRNTDWRGDTFISINHPYLDTRYHFGEKYDAIVIESTFPHGTPTEKVEKIMRDRAAKFKAEREGL